MRSFRIGSLRQTKGEVVHAGKSRVEVYGSGSGRFRPNYMGVPKIRVPFWYP